MSALCLGDALKLYKLLEFVLPEVEADTSPLEFVGKVVYNIKATNQHKIYVEALALMQGTTIEVILATYTAEESLIEFSRGLEENQILLLRGFCERVGI